MIYTIELAERIAEYRPRWLEECVMPDRIDSYVRVKQSTNIALAGAEHEYTRWGFKRFIDAEAEEVPEVVVRDRQHLAEDGFVIVVVAVDSNGKLIRDPEIITRGLVHVDASQEMLDEVRGMLARIFVDSAPDELRDSDVLQEKMRSMLKRYFRKTMGRRPLVLPVIWEM